MTTHIALFALSFAYVFLKAMQQLTVANFIYARVLPLSLGMGLCEVSIVLLVVKADSIVMGLINGLGAGLGALTAMWFHQLLAKRKSKNGLR